MSKRCRVCPSWTPLTFLLSSSDEIVTIVVGASGACKDFILPLGLVERYSEKLKSKLRNTSSGDTPDTRTMSLTDIMAEDFEVFVLFMYTGHIYSIGTDGNDPREWDHLARLWTLGHALESTYFKDAIVDAIVQKGKSAGKYPDHLDEILGETIQQITGMRRLLVDIINGHHSVRALRQSCASPALKLFYYDCRNALTKGQSVVYNMVKAEERLREVGNVRCC